GENGKYEYSNAGYTVAACLAERATQKSWEDLMRARVFAPLRLHTAGFGWPASARNPHAPRGHDSVQRPDAGHQPSGSDTSNAQGTKPAVAAAGDSLVPAPLDGWYRLGACLAPGGDVHCSMGDLARFAAFHLSRGASNPGLLPPDIFDMLHTDSTGDSLGYAMGWQLVRTRKGEPVLMHDGTAGPFYCRLVVFPQRDRAVAVATNVGGDLGQAACEKATGPLLRVAETLPPRGD